MIENEMGIDNYYIPDAQIILVRINSETVLNPVLKEW